MVELIGKTCKNIIIIGIWLWGMGSQTNKFPLITYKNARNVIVILFNKTSYSDFGSIPTPKKQSLNFDIAQKDISFYLLYSWYFEDILHRS